MWQCDPDLSSAKSWKHRGRIEDLPPVALQTDDAGRVYTLGFWIAPTSGSTLEGERFYENPIHVWEAWGYALLGLHNALERGVMTLDHYYPKPSAMLIDALETLGQEMVVFRETLRSRDG